MPQLIFLVSLVFFLWLHVTVAGWVRQPFHVNLKLSRGIAAVILAAVGGYALVRWWPLWRQAFLERHDTHSGPFYIVCFLAGHLIADLLWMANGALRAGSKPRTDLVLHHLFGLAACGAAYSLSVGYVMIAVALTTEIMPMSTGLNAWGKVTGNSWLRLVSLRFCIVVLLCWRLPLWSFALGVVVWNMSTGGGPGYLQSAYPICLAVALALIVLDIYWSSESVGAVRRFLIQERQLAPQT